jgi:hypothetical protein
MRQAKAIALRDYYGVAGLGRCFYIAILDDIHQPIRRLSGFFESHAEALPYLRWARLRHPCARLVRENIARVVVD